MTAPALEENLVGKQGSFPAINVDVSSGSESLSHYRYSGLPSGVLSVCNLNRLSVHKNTLILGIAQITPPPSPLPARTLSNIHLCFRPKSKKCINQFWHTPPQFGQCLKERMYFSGQSSLRYFSGI